jgi:hypothetical protein
MSVQSVCMVTNVGTKKSYALFNNFYRTLIEKT